MKMPFQFWSRAIILKQQSSKQQHKVFRVKLTNSVRITTLMDSSRCNKKEKIKSNHVRTNFMILRRNKKFSNLENTT